MKKFLHVAAIGLVAGFAAQAAPYNKDPDATGQSMQNQTAEAPDKNESTNKMTSAVKGGTVLNTDVSPQQAKRVAEETNRQILRERARR